MTTGKRTNRGRSASSGNLTKHEALETRSSCVLAGLWSKWSKWSNPSESEFQIPHANHVKSFLLGVAHSMSEFATSGQIGVRLPSVNSQSWSHASHSHGLTRGRIPNSRDSRRVRPAGVQPSRTTAPPLHCREAPTGPPPRSCASDWLGHPQNQPECGATLDGMGSSSWVEP